MREPAKDGTAPEVQREDIVRLDKAHVWHPYTPMDEWQTTDPIVVRRAEGAWLEDVNGARYLDGNSSWYTATLGHGHPRLRRAMNDQLASLAHCSLAGITHEPAARLAEELVALAPSGLTRVFFVDNGSTAIEASLKMAIQGWRQLGFPEKTRFIAIDGAFHGDTIGATSLGGVPIFREMFGGVTFDCIHTPFPDPFAHERAFETVRNLLRENRGTVAGVFVEPIVQAVSGMRIYGAELLREMRSLCDEYGAWLVADEVFTGLGRTGPMWACEHAGIAPDIMCVGKALAAFVPLGAVLARDTVFDAFRGGRERAFLYGHTFCGNPAASAVAREVLAIYRDEDVLAQVERKSVRLRTAFEGMAEIPGVHRVRSIGLIGAADLADTKAGYLGRTGWRVYDEARARGAYVRPLGSTVYLCPPLTIPDAELDALLFIFEESVRAALST